MSSFRRGIWNLWLWIGLGIIFAALNLGNSSEPKSRYWFSELALYSLMLSGLWANAKFDLRKKLPIPRKIAPAVYVFLVWLFGMIFELSLTVTGEGVGGLHAETLPSFILAQGDYIPIALISYIVIRRTQASFREVFFFSGGKSRTEACSSPAYLPPCSSHQCSGFRQSYSPITLLHTVVLLLFPCCLSMKNCYGRSSSKHDDTRYPFSGYSVLF